MSTMPSQRSQFDMFDVINKDLLKALQAMCAAKGVVKWLQEEVKSKFNNSFITLFSQTEVMNSPFCFNDLESDIVHYFICIEGVPYN